MKKHSERKGIAIISALGVCVVLLALGSVLMINSYSHMSMSMRYYYETEALNIAEGGINYVIHDLETKTELSQIPATNPYIDITLGRGSFKAYEYSNISSNASKSSFTDAFGDQRTVPPYSILIVSKGTVQGGGNSYSKIVESLVHYQFVPYTLCSESQITMNDPVTSGGNHLNIQVDSIDGFTSNIQSNYTAGSPYAGYNRTLILNGATLSASGMIDANEVAVIQAGGGVPESNISKKQFFNLTYGSLKGKFGGCTNLDQNMPGGFTFTGEMKNNGGTLEARCEDFFGVKHWYDVSAFGALPDGMDWDGNVLNINGSNNYQWNGNLTLTGIHIKVADNKSSALFVGGNITGYNMIIEGQSFTLASNDQNIALYNTSMNINSPVNTNKVAIYGGSLTISTSVTPPPGGNKFKGVVYTTKGQINLINQSASGPDNIISLEGIIINSNPFNLPDTSIGLHVLNNGGDDCKVEFKYNPYVTDYVIDYQHGPVYLQPVYWRID